MATAALPPPPAGYTLDPASLPPPPTGYTVDSASPKHVPTIAERMGIVSPWAKASLDMMEGANNTLNRHVYGLADLVSRTFGGPSIMANPQVAAASTTPSGPAGKAGEIAENAGEFLAPAAKVAQASNALKLGTAARATLQAATGAGVASEQTGGDPLAMTLAGLMSGVPEVMGPALAKFAAEYAPRLYQSALKPPGIGSARTSIEDVKNLVQRAISTDTPISEAGLAQTGNRITALNDEIRSTLEANGNPPGMVQPTNVIKPLEQMQAAPTSVTPGEAQGEMDAAHSQYLTKHTADAPFQPIAQVRDQFTGRKTFQPSGPINPNPTVQEYTPLAAQDEKVATYKEVGDAAYGQQTGAWTEARKALARGVKDEIQRIFPEVAGKNAQEGLDIELQDAIEHRLKLAGNREIATFSPYNTAMRMIESPEIKSRIALALSRAGSATPGADITLRKQLSAAAQAAVSSANRPKTLSEMMQQRIDEQGVQ